MDDAGGRKGQVVMREAGVVLLSYSPDAEKVAHELIYVSCCIVGLIGAHHIDTICNVVPAYRCLRGK
jgi:hypothetical protein